MMKQCVRYMLVAVVLAAGVVSVLSLTGCMGPDDAPRTEMILAFDDAELDNARLEELKQAGRSDSEIQARVKEMVMEVVGHRLRGMKIREPLIEALDSHQIRVQFRGAVDLEQAQRLIEQTKRLEFHLVASPEETADVIEAVSDAYPNLNQFVSTEPVPPQIHIVADENLEAVKSAIASAHKRQLIPEDKVILFGGPIHNEYVGLHNQMYLVEREPIQTGDGLTRAKATPPSWWNPSYWAIRCSFDSATGTHFGEVTEANIGRMLAIVVDDTVISAPVIQSKITANVYITGAFDEAGARQLAIALESGPMPVPVRVVSVDVVNDDSPGEAEAGG